MINYESLTKRYYSIGEVAELFGIKASVLRFWEDSFKMLRPRKSGGGKRLYTVDNIKLIEHIYKLVREEGYTLEGAEQVLRQDNDPIHQPLSAQDTMKLKQRLTKVQRRMKGMLKRLNYHLTEEE